MHLFRQLPDFLGHILAEGRVVYKDGKFLL